MDVATTWSRSEYFLLQGQHCSYWYSWHCWRSQIAAGTNGTSLKKMMSVVCSYIMHIFNDSTERNVLFQICILYKQHYKWRFSLYRLLCSLQTEIKACIIIMPGISQKVELPEKESFPFLVQVTLLKLGGLCNSSFPAPGVNHCKTPEVGPLAWCWKIFLKFLFVSHTRMAPVFVH